MEAEFLTEKSYPQSLVRLNTVQNWVLTKAIEPLLFLVS
jgi:hypothetical protein